MSYLLLALLAIAIATIGWWTRYSWLRLTYAICFIVAQILVLALLIDVHGHAAMKTEIEKRGAMPDAPLAVVKTAQMQDRASAMLVTLGLYLLAVVPQRTQDGPT